MLVGEVRIHDLSLITPLFVGFILSVSFVSCVVVGSVSIAIRQSGVQVAKSAFVRDVYFLLFVVLALFGIFYLW